MPPRCFSLHSAFFDIFEQVCICSFPFLLLKREPKRLYYYNSIMQSANQLNGGGRRQALSSIDFYRRVPKDLTEVRILIIPARLPCNTPATKITGLFVGMNPSKTFCMLASCHLFCFCSLVLLCYSLQLPLSLLFFVLFIYFGKRTNERTNKQNIENETTK